MDPAICIACERPVTNRQQGLECDGCQRWQHRTCGTGITQAEYRAAARAGREIDWRCATCPQIPVLEIQVLPEDGLVQIPVQIPALPALPEALPQLLPELPQEPARPRVSLYVGDLTDFAVPQQLPEPELENPAPRPRPVVPVDGPVTYTVVPASTTMGNDSLLDSLGYRYTVKVDKRRAAVTWRCFSRRNPPCKATVMERDDSYVRGSQHHVCAPQPRCRNIRCKLTIE